MGEQMGFRRRMRFAPVAAAVATVALVASPTMAAELDQLGRLDQRQFRSLSEDLGAALSYKPLVPAEPLGVAGFDIGAEIGLTRLKSAEVFDRATSGDSPSVLPVPRLHVHKGLPLGIDIGVSYTSIPQTNIDVWGGELRYALLEGGAALPALALRASYSRMSGVDQLDLSTRGVDLSVSKGFLFLTPYAGVGRVWVSASPNGVPGLAGESFAVNKLFGGANLAFGIFSVAMEIDRTGEVWSYGGKVALRF
jgi:hypothetical protein